MDSTVAGLHRRVAEQSSLLEAEASARGRLEVELSAAMQRAEAAERIVRERPPPTPSVAPAEAAQLREEALVQARRADEASASAAAATAAANAAGERARAAMEAEAKSSEAAATARAREAQAVEVGEALRRRVEQAEASAKQAAEAAAREAASAVDEATHACKAEAAAREASEARMGAEVSRLTSELRLARGFGRVECERGGGGGGELCGGRAL